ncbi:MAG: hypothetical protein KJ970_09985 [Candidatus Eisenbacteria bacterium]|uniref:Gingipain domain-containing protein n=1 Tax=Eiseniibacteriota bacterium TaxID=2212470 RepID=A0A948RUH6_UNCEI|nr:hypothetical protein [Candidatus Eisenbacteria bacterium]MBU1947649.1 hypothetical protein [Candidatus Eisenbacteria bacterium]MBU2691248.1 hypothetical protein [Candidatus Eisenbacteria bacterium]
MRSLLFGNLLMLLTSAGVMAACETSTSNTAAVIEPYQFALGPGRGAFVVSAEDQEYFVSQCFEIDGDSQNDCGVNEWVDILSQGHGLLQTITHGDSDGLAVEAYSDEQDRDTAWDILEDSGFPMDQLYKAQSSNGWHISMKPWAIGSRFVSAKTLVYNGCCYSHTYHDQAWPGARCILGYSGSCPTSEFVTDITAFWPRMAGDDPDYRSVEGALAGLDIDKAGNDDHTLSPFVLSTSPVQDAQIPSGGKDFEIVLDTETNQVVDPLRAEGPFALEDVHWDGKHKIKGKIIPNGDGAGQIIVDASVVASNNHDELLLNGGVDFELRVRHDEDPAAEIHGFSVRQDRAEWKVSSLFKTAVFRVEEAADAMGPWSVVRDGILPAIGRMSVPLAVSSGQLYRLVEIEIGGDLRVHGTASIYTPEFIPAATPHTIAGLRQKIVELNALRAGTSYGGVMTGGNSRLVIYAYPALVEAVQYAIADFWGNWWGVDVEVISTGTFPSEPEAFRQALKSDIAGYDNGDTRFLLVGDGNDHRQFTGPEYPLLWLPENGWEAIRQGYLGSGYEDQSAHDLIPTWYTPDILPRDESMAWVTPYRMGDMIYMDTDTDSLGLPDVIVGRLPFTTEDEIYSYGYKLQDYHGGWYGVGNVSFLVGDRDHNGVSGQTARAIADAVEQIVPGGISISHLYESDVPNDAERNTAAADLWNSASPGVVYLLSSVSNRSWPGNFYDQTNLANPWDMAMIHPYGTHAAVVVAASCNSGDFARTEDSDFGTPIGHKFLAEADKGAVIWIGPTAGTWQTGNDPLARYLAEELFNHDGRPVGDAFLAAVRRVMIDYADQSEILATVSSYVFLGDPMVPLNMTNVPVAVEDSPTPLRLFFSQNAPNPLHPGQASVFSLSLPLRSEVELNVYDVSGRRVVDLVPKSLWESGRYRITWDGSTKAGYPAATGVYNAVLSVDDRKAFAKKVVIVR